MFVISKNPIPPLTHANWHIHAQTNSTNKIPPHRESTSEPEQQSLEDEAINSRSTARKNQYARARFVHYPSPANIAEIIPSISAVILTRRDALASDHHAQSSLPPSMRYSLYHRTAPGLPRPLLRPIWQSEGRKKNPPPEPPAPIQSRISRLFNFLAPVASIGGYAGAATRSGPGAGFVYSTRNSRWACGIEIAGALRFCFIFIRPAPCVFSLAAVDPVRYSRESL